jgi:hypothetical protein
VTRFNTATDTPCPIRLGRMGYTRTGEFRVPEPQELFILPTDSAPLEDHEPQVVGACGVAGSSEPRHIVKALSEETRKEIEQLGGLFFFLGSARAWNELEGLEADPAQDEAA